MRNMTQITCPSGGMDLIRCISLMAYSGKYYQQKLTWKCWYYFTWTCNFNRNMLTGRYIYYLEMYEKMLFILNTFCTSCIKLTKPLLFSQNLLLYVFQWPPRHVHFQGERIPASLTSQNKTFFTNELSSCWIFPAFFCIFNHF